MLRNGIIRTIIISYFVDMDNASFEKFDQTVRLAPSVEDLMQAVPGEMNVLQAASNYGLDKYVRCLLEYPGKFTRRLQKTFLI